ncbi:DUF1648 domain-containing protein [Acutalibacter sp. 1XD8-33]|uniref:SdpI family protein n=1 Tax=Acutalibacter sp. 1XD8-33 TaxID=2320081 RepID=UPI000EA15754|nr:DUF1648 domain-containing protein [Acutalibacter sp. 1XD8-33]RKJ40460.1 DUF1648 domain-containing protein [Acutalibacter sp. 1XD8-33]
MLRQNKGKFLISSAVILLPILAGLFLWQKLPEEVATHFNFRGEADGWSSRTFGVFGLPLILLGAHLFCIILTSVDPKSKNIGSKPISLLFWLMPAVSLVMNGALYAYALGMQIGIGTVCMLLLGAMCIVLGNYLPKVRQNYSFGVKVSWALDDPENWAATQRVGGWSLVIGGLILLATAFWPNLWIILFTVLLSSLAPVVYSFCYYKRHRKERDL